ncbi:MAG: hypothetical protein U9P61_00320 [Patescibacteria group bacterium]|nr:hypothetical protein [Patescibacteria group bacterium]
MNNFPKSIKIKIFYEGNIDKITGKKFEEAAVSEGIDFINMLYFITESYPEIKEKYPPGQLGLLLNKKPPKVDELLKDNDEIILRTRN